MAHSKINSVLRNGGLGRRGTNGDAVQGCVMNAIAVVDGLELDKIYRFRSIQDLEELKVDEAYDETNSVLVHHRIKRFFRKNPNGDLYVMFVDQDVTLTEMVDKDEDYLKKVLKDNAGKIKFAWIALNPPTDYEATLSAGFDADVLTAIPKAEALWADELAQYRYLHGVLIEGRSLNGSMGAVQNLHAITNVVAPHVSVTVLADPTISAKAAIYNGYAAVEDVARLIALAALSQNIGENIELFNLNDEAEGVFSTCGLSNNKTLAEMSDTDPNTLHATGAIFGEIVPGLNGFYLNDAFTCTSLTSDYAYIENNRVIMSALEAARIKLLPHVNSRIKIDPTNGQMTDTDRSGLEDIASGAVDAKMNAGKDNADISGNADAWIDPATNLLTGDKLIVKLSMIPLAIGREIELSVGFTNPFKS